jgi:hypothetical protein
MDRYLPFLETQELLIRSKYWYFFVKVRLLSYSIQSLSSWIVRTQ